MLPGVRSDGGVLDAADLAVMRPLAALPLTLLIAWGFSSFFPIALGLSMSTALLVSVAITIVVLLATWVPTRRAVALPPREALWRE